MSPLVKYVIRNLGTRPFITGIVLASMIAVGATLGGTIGIVSGLVRAFSSHGHDNWVIVVSRDALAEVWSELPPQSLAPLTVRSEVKQFSPEVAIQSLNETPQGVVPLTLRGLEPQGFELHGLKLIEGRMPTPGEPEFIAGDALRSRFPWLKIGSTLNFLNENFTCVGYFNAEGYYTGELWTSRAEFLRDSRRTALSVVYLVTASKADALALVDKLKSDRSTPVDANTEATLHAQLLSGHQHTIDVMFIVMVLIIGGATLSASSLLSLLQSRRIAELVTLRAIGFRARVITLLILWETEFLALSGGLVGLLIAMLALQNYSANSSSPRSTSGVTFRANLTWQHFGLALGILFVIGIIGALAPIVRARSVQITHGLREE